MLASHVLVLAAALAARVTAEDHHVTVTAAPSQAQQTDPSSTSSTSSAPAGPATIAIAVGADGHVFTPKEAKAEVGDIIRFNFYPGGHRVARAAFKYPCIPYEHVGANKAGFYTGIFAPQVISNPPPHYDVWVNDTEPIFFYCASPGSCIDYHMIGVVNPNATHTLDAQLAAAREAPYQLAPGEPFPTETPSPRPPPSPSPPPPPPPGGDGAAALGAGPIAGIAIGGTAVVLLAAVVIYLCGRRGGFDKAYRKMVGFSNFGGGVGGGGAVVPPDVLEARGGGGGGGGYPANPKSPSPAPMSTMMPVFDPSAVVGGYPVGGGGGGQGGSPHPLSPPGAGQHGGGYGFGDGYGAAQTYQGSSMPDQNSATTPAELATPDSPVQKHTPPPGYVPPRDSWRPGQEAQYRPGGKQ